jgi:hypothetical protein
MATRYNYTGGIVTNGLVLNLDAAKTDSYPGTGTTWRDISGNNNNGTLTNGPTFSGIGKQASIVFDGTNDYVDCGTTNIIPGSWTVSVWVKYQSKAGGSVYFGRSGAGPSYDQTAIVAWAPAYSNRFFVSGKTTTGTYLSSCSSSFVPTNGVIYNVIGTFDTSSTVANLYINGALDNTKIVGTLFTTGSNLSNQVGCSDGISPSNFTSGSIYNVQVYNRALSATEITQNFNALRSRYGI